MSHAPSASRLSFSTALRLFHWQVIRYTQRHKLLAFLNIASIALGVGVYLAVQIANHSSNRALQASVELVAGKASLEARGEMDDAVFPAIQRLPGVLAATPLLEGVVTLPDFPGEYLRIYGVDPFTNLPFATFKMGDQRTGAGFDFETWLTDPKALAVSEDFAKKYHLAVGKTLNVLVNSRVEALTIRFVIRSEVSLEGSGTRVAAMDIASAQALFGVAGKITGVGIITAPGKESGVAENIRRLVPTTVTVAPPAQRNQQVSQMLQAFQLNLSALSLVSLLVGMFLVFNTVSASVVRRREEIGILRSGGVTQMQIRALFISEAFFYGVVGVVIGVFGGIVLSKFLVGAVGQTISSLYILLSIDQTFISPGHIALAMVAGLGSVLLAAWVPANAAANLPPAAVLNPGYELERSRKAPGHFPLIGLALIVISGVVGWISLQRWPWLGFGSAFFLLTGCSFFAPALTSLASRAIQKLSGFHLIPSLAAQNLRRSLVRVSLTVAALASAVAMMIGISVMIHSFRETIKTWIERSLVADLFIAPASNETVGLAAYLPPDAATWLAEQPQVREVDTFREMRVPFRNKMVHLSVVHGHRRDNLRFLEGDHERRNQVLFESGHVLISEPFARRFHLRADDVISLPTPVGARIFQIGGTYYDYTSDAGTILMARENFDPLWNDLRVHSLGVYLKEGADYELVADAFRKRFGGEMNFSLYSNRALRERIFEIFDQTFAVTSVLRVIAVGVAVMGIFLTLSTLVTERSRELAVLRAAGSSPGQVCQMVLYEGAMVGLLAAILGVLTGCGLAVILTFVVNKAFFGWTIQLAWPVGSLLFTPCWIVPVSILGGLIPAWRAAKMSLAPALRNS